MSPKKPSAKQPAARQRGKTQQVALKAQPPTRKPSKAATAKQRLLDEAQTAIERISHIRKRAFLVAYSTNGNVVRSCEIAGIVRGTHWTWLGKDPDYREAFEFAKLLAVESLESEAMRRALEGVTRPVYQGGKLVGRERVYSDTLMIFLLKGLMPDRYRENTRVTLPGGAEVEGSGALRIDQIEVAFRKTKVSTGEGGEE
jgi:hypothetical protein